MRLMTLSLLFVCWFGPVISAQTDRINFEVGTAERFAASSITWRGYFGSRKEEPKNMYTLMTQGGFRAPTSANLEQLIKGWLDKHPAAESVLVYTLEGVLTDVPDSKLKAV